MADWDIIGNPRDLLVEDGVQVGVPGLAMLTSSRAIISSTDQKKLYAYDWDGLNWSLTAASGAVFTGTLPFPKVARLSDTTFAAIDSESKNLRTYSFDGATFAQVGNSLNVAGLGYFVDMSSFGSNRVIIGGNGINGVRAYEFDGVNWAQVGNTYAISGAIQRAAVEGLSETQAVVAIGPQLTLNFIFLDFDGTDFTEAYVIDPTAEVNNVKIAALSEHRVVFAYSVNGTSSELVTYDWNGDVWVPVGATGNPAGNFGNIGIDKQDATHFALFDHFSNDLRIVEFSSPVTPLPDDRVQYRGTLSDGYVGGGNPLFVWTQGYLYHTSTGRPTGRTKLDGTKTLQHLTIRDMGFPTWGSFGGFFMNAAADKIATPVKDELWVLTRTDGRWVPSQSLAPAKGNYWAASQTLTAIGRASSPSSEGFRYGVGSFDNWTWYQLTPAQLNITELHFLTHLSFSPSGRYMLCQAWGRYSGGSVLYQTYMYDLLNPAAPVRLWHYTGSEGFGRGLIVASLWTDETHVIASIGAVVGSGGEYVLDNIPKIRGWSTASGTPAWSVNDPSGASNTRFGEQMAVVGDLLYATAARVVSPSNGSSDTALQPTLYQFDFDANTFAAPSLQHTLSLSPPAWVSLGSFSSNAIRLLKGGSEVYHVGYEDETYSKQMLVKHSVSVGAAAYSAIATPPHELSSGEDEIGFWADDSYYLTSVPGVDQLLLPLGASNYWDGGIGFLDPFGDATPFVNSDWGNSLLPLSLSPSAISDTTLQWDIEEEVAAAVESDLLTANLIDNGWLDVTSIMNGQNIEGVALSPDRTKLVMTTDDFGSYARVHQWTLATPGVITSGITYDGFINIFGNSFPTRGTLYRCSALKFNPDGSKLYVMDESLNSIGQFSLTVAGDVMSGHTWDGGLELLHATWSWYGRWFDISSDGSKLIIFDHNIDLVASYSLTTAWDILGGETFDGDFNCAANGANWAYSGSISEDGTKLYVMDGNQDRLFQWSLTTPNDIVTGRSYDGFVAIDTWTMDTAYSYGMSVRDDQMLIIRQGAVDAVKTFTFEAGPPSAYTAIGATYSGNSFNLLGDMSHFAGGMQISSDGTKLWVGEQGGASTAKLWQWTLNTPGTLAGGATLDGSVELYSAVANQEMAYMRGFGISSDGGKLVLYDPAWDRLNEYEFVTPGDILGGLTWIRNATVGVFADYFTMHQDGVSMYLTDLSADTVYEYILGKSWDIGSGVFLNSSANVGATTTSPGYAVMSPFLSDNLIVLNQGASRTIHQYSNNSFWYLNVLTHTGSLDVSGTIASNLQGGFCYNRAATKFWVISDGTGDVKIYEYDVA